MALQSTVSSRRAEHTPRVAAWGPRLDGRRLGGRDREEEEARAASSGEGKLGVEGEDGAAPLQSWGGESRLFSGRAASTWGQEGVM